MSTLGRRADRRFKISNKWLTENDDHPEAYIDLWEVKISTSTNVQSNYLQWLINQHTIAAADVDALAAKANFTTLGIHCDVGGVVDGCLLEDPDGWRDVTTYAGEITHPHAYRRIWADRTTARGISIVGIVGD